MPLVLTTSSTILCGPAAPMLHGGTVQNTSTAKLTVAGSPVLVKSDIQGKSVTACATVPPPQTNTPCSFVNSPLNVTAGEATRLTAGGGPVLLATLASLAGALPT